MASSLKKAGGASAPMAVKIGQAIDGLRSGYTKATHGMADTGFSLESFAGDTSSVATLTGFVKGHINAAFGDSYWDTMTDVQRDSAIISARATMSQASIESYARAYDDVVIGTRENTTVFGLPGNMAPGSRFEYNVSAPKREYSQEVFDDRNLNNMAATTILHNVLASRQTEAAEAFYPGYALPADGTGFTVEVDRPLVFDRIKHTLDGATVDFNKQRQLLLNAYMDATILANNPNRIIPCYVDGNAKNTAHFTSSIAPKSVTVAGETFLTAPLKPSAKPFSLLGISQHPGIASMGQNDQTDTLDHLVVLERVYFKIKAPDPASPSTILTSIISFDTSQLETCQFNPAAEGQQRKMVLTFLSQDLPIDGTTLDVNGVEAAALKALRTNPAFQGLRINLTASVSGNVNLESSAINVTGAPAEIDSIARMTGSGANKQFAIVSEEAVVDAIRTAIPSIEFDSYDVKSFRSNVNRRDQGKLTTNERLRDAHIVPFSPTYTAQVPIIDGIHNTVDISIPGQNLMIRNTNNAYSQLLTFEESLKQASDAAVKSVPNPAIRAIGRYILRRPWYEHRKLNLAEEVNSLRSHDRMQDIQAAINNVLRVMATRAFYYTNFQSAMHSQGMGNGVKPKIKILCNPILRNYLIIQGDNRLLGDGWEYEIFTDQDSRFIDVDPTKDNAVSYRLYSIFSLPGVDGPHPLNFGNFVYLPDVMTNLPITRDQSTTREMSYQSRTLHVNHCPVLMRLDVQGLEQAAAERMAIPFSPT